MILLMGGTSEAASIALALAEAGDRVLLSTATDFFTESIDHPLIEMVSGKLDEGRLISLISKRHIRAIIDATHPYAVEAHETARQSAEKMNIPYLAFVRPAGIFQNDKNVVFAQNHAEAAQIACSQGRPVLLTTGSRNLSPYVSEAGKTGSPLIVRVLPEEESLNACRKAGLEESSVVTGRGPFSVAENREIIHRFGIAVLVTKDSGIAGGVQEKLEAARIEGCLTVVVKRPIRPLQNAYDNIPDLIAAFSLKVKSLK